MKLKNMKANLKDGAAGQPVAATVLFADICGSTRLFEKYGDWRARQIEAQVLGLLMARTNENGGTVIKTIGDEVMSRFPSAQQAVRAACGMHQALRDDVDLAGLNISIRIGLHHGQVLVESDDVFGDAVNVAARMASLAKADQIMTTRETIGELSDDLQKMTRNLGQSRVRGKREQMELAEVIWHDTTSLTQIAGGHEDLRNLLFARLTLEYRGHTFELAPSSQVFTIGRGEKNHLVVDRELVSRSHAAIEFRQGKFILMDQSTNGTYLQLESGARFFVRREELTLQERGLICFGQAAIEQNPDVVRYACSYTDGFEAAE
ncbi:MAG TPA: adenylate/guanylate cyclase domain-containing protein [Candidatus Competibacteraceae bacterium]|nr:MAG: adenylate/guanylate cyclase domain-containing protein [Candidatus Competibacteraceae bacterium]HOB62800.1 adenylate/guanylate cyclase domain-containing protein [Candidatus Competibacteraceae bacterium]HQA25920.1 adenylate/guanylate cyclase domain-containing protein [Candidatus Competibacteraceae bacterium]HQD56217.1 adenylate/guanylate cyclase domain-containing protein [Candidatus Competibacteraceae bacterium]